MKRNNVKLHDSICFLVQENEEAKKERKLQTSLLKELCHEVKLLVKFETFLQKFLGKEIKNKYFLLFLEFEAKKRHDFGGAYVSDLKSAANSDLP